jgi:gliding motility-associated protein GldE
LESIPGEPPVNIFLSVASILRPHLSSGDIATAAICSIVILILIIFSAIIASSENAFFSLSKAQAADLSADESGIASAARYLLAHPKKLLATILVANTFVNIAIVMVSGYMFEVLFDFGDNQALGIVFELTLITFTLVLLGEVMPKIYASQNNIQVARFNAIPMYALNRLLTPFVYVLVKSTSIIDKRVTKKGHVLSVDELSHAIDITSETDTSKEEKTILKSIVNFGNITVRQIMRQRPDVSAVEAGMNFRDLLQRINDWGYSRVPVYRDNLDNIIGVLYIKDLLPHMKKDGSYEWLELVRKPYFVPESKKIDDLLKEFQQKRVHVAIVVDEFGGTSGMATMEDILEEIFGEIRDEFDEDENFYSRINDTTFVFEAKTLINDMCRLMEIDVDTFEDARNDADTLGGMLIELVGDLPQRGQKISYENFTFVVEAVDKRRIKRVKVIIAREEAEA